MTQFVYVSVDVAPGLALVIDGNSKITAGNGSYFDPAPNALSLPPVVTCPGSTEICRRSCYVRVLAANAPDVFGAYVQNEMALYRALQADLLYLTAKSLGDWISKHCQGGFRWHVSGDVFSVDHALWISQVCYESPNVNHWIYTRSFWAVLDLLDTANLTVNLSADAENLAEALMCHKQNPRTRICYLTHDGHVPDLPPGSVIFPDYPCRGREMQQPTDHPWWSMFTQEQKRMVCPADFFGQSAQHRCGPCKKCLKESKVRP